MKDKVISTVIKECEMGELTAEEQSLVNSAIAALSNSYAPYSHFNVGAALRLCNGEVVTGANQENASFSVTVCAERSAIFNAQSNCPEQPVAAIAIAAKNAGGLLAEPISPCGVCRQALLEIERRYRQDIRIYLYGTRRVYIAESVKDLLPLSFTDETMERKTNN